jgi:hypothetical protein
VVRRRLWLRYGRWAAALAGCYVAGLVTFALTRPGAPSDAPTANGLPPGVPASVAPPDHPDPRANLPEDVRRWLAEGDRYATEAGDLEAALRSYRLALDAGGDDALVIAPTDNWLLISLKTARLKERTDANRNG